MHYIYTVIVVICFYLINLLALRQQCHNVVQQQNVSSEEMKKFEEILCLNIHTNDFLKCMSNVLSICNLSAVFVFSHKKNFLIV